jgi:hypothetical protein
MNFTTINTKLNDKSYSRDQIQFPQSLSTSGTHEGSKLHSYNNAIQNNNSNVRNTRVNQSNSRDQIQNGLNARKSIPTTMNYPMHNNSNSNRVSYIDRSYNTSQNNPVQVNMQTNYEFDKLNFMKIPNNYGGINHKPLDTRRQTYENTKQTDDLFYKNNQGNLYNFFDNKPTSTRLSENTQNRGLDPNLLPKKVMYIPNDKL